MLRIEHVLFRAIKLLSCDQFPARRLAILALVVFVVRCCTGNRTFRHFDVSPPGRFAPWTVCHLDVLPPGRFAAWTFRRLDVSPLDGSPPGRFTTRTFTPWTVRHLDVLPPGRFAAWTFRHQDVSPPGRFATWTFRPHAMVDSPPKQSLLLLYNCLSFFC